MKVLHSAPLHPNSELEPTPLLNIWQKEVLDNFKYALDHSINNANYPVFNRPKPRENTDTYSRMIDDGWDLSRVAIHLYSNEYGLMGIIYPTTNTETRTIMDIYNLCKCPMDNIFIYVV